MILLTLWRLYANLSGNAGKDLNALFADKPQSGIRIYLAPGGYSGPRPALAMDETTDEGKVLEAEVFCLP